jgi:histone-lysine N-methyltransferase ASH1L
MSFDQNMIIDATTGSIARFVNHSCNPNCRMIKWIVAGNPRMALFAGDRPIMSGEELTYDYKFDPFSAKNVQKCLCGEPNCRGVLGPKPREVKPAKGKADLKEALKASVKAGKRKLKELVGDDEEPETSKAKKRKISPAKGLKRSLSNASIRAAKGAAKGAATAVRRSVSTITVGAKAFGGKASGGPKPGPRRASTGGMHKTSTKKSPAKRIPAKRSPLKKSPLKKSPLKKSPVKRITAKTNTEVVDVYEASPAQVKATSRSWSTSTIVASAGDENAVAERVSPLSKSGRVRKLTEKARSPLVAPRKALELSRAAKIRLVEATEAASS